MKKLYCRILYALGMPQVWILIMLVLVVFEVINGVTIFGGFWVAVCLMAYFLSRIANAIESLKEERDAR